MSTYEHTQEQPPANENQAPWPDYRPEGGFFKFAREIVMMTEGELEKVLAGGVR
jgi:hypothetical protein